MDNKINSTTFPVCLTRRDQTLSRFISLCLIVVTFFGLSGAFLSNLFEIPKLHYAPLAITVFLVGCFSFRSRFLPLYVCAALLAAASPLLASEPNEFLSYFVMIVLPIVWFCAGRLVNLSYIAHGFAYICLALIIGLLLELSEFFPDLFPIILAGTGQEPVQRYGSFALNPLALGYFAGIGAILSLGLRNRAYSRITFVGFVILMLFANSRGAVVTFLAALVIFRLLKRRKAKEGKRAVPSVALGFLFVVIFCAAALLNERVRSTFDWSADEGNLGRLTQWSYCFSSASQNPLGVGPGAMSPIGIGDDPFIEEGIVKSCDSTFLKLAVEYGFAAALFYCVVIFWLLYFAWRGTRRIAKSNGASNRDVSSLVIAFSIVCALFLQQFLNQTLESIWIGAVFFSFLGGIYWNLRLPLRKQILGFFGRTALMARKMQRSIGPIYDQPRTANLSSCNRPT